MMFLDCPAYLDQDGAARCGLPAEVRCRFIVCSTGGPLESAMTRCSAGYWFSGPIESLTAPAYYLGRPAGVWITAMSPCRRGTASTHLMPAVRP